MSDDTPSPRPPYRVEVTDRAAELQAAHAGLADGEGSGVTATVAGRVMLLRDDGPAGVRDAARLQPGRSS